MNTAHTRESFTFTVQAPLDQAAPLFGAHKEQAWEPDFDPKFIHPIPAQDVQGMVFTVSHGERQTYG